VNEVSFLAFKYEKIGSIVQKSFLKKMTDQVTDSSLKKNITPLYRIGCKRILLASNYYQTLSKSNVSLVTSPILNIGKSSIITEDETYDVDVIVYCTGFQTDDCLKYIVIENGEEELHEKWEREGSRSYLGIVTTGFPNMYMLGGPNTVIGHTSALFLIECGTNYIVDCITHTIEGGYRHLDLKKEVEDEFYETIQNNLKKSVWANCESWYQNKKGEIINWPYSTLYMWWAASTTSFNIFNKV